VRTPGSLFRQTATVTRPGEDWGDGPQDGEPVTVRCRLDWGSRRAQGPDGVEVTVEGVLLCRHDVDVRAGDTVRLPSVRPDDEAIRTVHAVNPAYGPTGRVRHLEVLFR